MSKKIYEIVLWCVCVLFFREQKREAGRDRDRVRDRDRDRNRDRERNGAVLSLCLMKT